MEDHFGIAAFRSRQQVMAFEQALRQNGIRAEIVNTPRSIAAGCGLSVKFSLEDAPAAAEVHRAVRTGNLIGFYCAHREGPGKLSVTPLGLESGYTG